MDVPSIRKPGGRPPARKIKPGDRVPLSLRVTPDIKKRLDAAAKYNGRSQSQEAEFRLARSFDREALLVEVLALRHGPQAAAVMLVLSNALHAVEQLVAHLTLHEGGQWPNDKWLDDHRAYGAAVSAISAALADLHPDSQGVTNPPPEAKHSWEGIGSFAGCVAMLMALGNRDILQALPGDRRRALASRKGRKQ